MPPSLPLSCPPRVMEGSQAGRRGPAPEVLRWLQALRPGTAAQRPASYFSLPHPTRVHYVHSLPLDRRGNWVVALDRGSGDVAMLFVSSRDVARAPGFLPDISAFGPSLLVATLFI